MVGIDEMSMHCDPCSPEAYSMYVGGHRASRARQLAIPAMRPAGRLKKKRRKIDSPPRVS
jgi:hypothetical protein